MASDEVTFLAQCFSYKGRAYNYLDIAHLSWHATHTNVSLNSLPAGSYDEATLKVIFRTSDVLKLSAGAKLFPKDRLANHFCNYPRITRTSVCTGTFSQTRSAVSTGNCLTMPNARHARSPRDKPNALLTVRNSPVINA